MSRLKQAGKFTAIGALAIALVGGFEGLRTTAYRDVVGIPTVCFGETRGVKMGDKYTVEECKVMLGDGLIDFEKGIVACLKNPKAIPDKSYVAFISVAYNIGQPAFCNSTMRRELNNGNLVAACDAILMWDKAGKPKRKIKGLTLRRIEEKNLCLEGVKNSVGIVG